MLGFFFLEKEQLPRAPCAPFKLGMHTRRDSPDFYHSCHVVHLKEGKAVLEESQILGLRGEGGNF